MNTQQNEAMTGLFPVVRILRDQEAIEAVAQLMESDMVSSGCSFAVTMDCGFGYRKLWLSRMAARRLDLRQENQPWKRASV